MSARTLVFVAVALVGIFALYLDTRGGWNWARLMRGLLLALVIVVGGIAGLVYWSSLPPSEPVSHLWDISLGASKSDVRFLKGDPSEIIEPATWAYASSSSRTYHLVFGDADEVIRILVASGPGFSSGASLLGVRMGFDVQRLVDRLGRPSRVVPLPDNLRRAYLYDHRNAVFVLEQGAVTTYGIYDVEAGDPYEGDG